MKKEKKREREAGTRLAARSRFVPTADRRKEKKKRGKMDAGYPVYSEKEKRREEEAVVPFLLSRSRVALEKKKKGGRR